MGRYPSETAAAVTTSVRRNCRKTPPGKCRLHRLRLYRPQPLMYEQGSKMSISLQSSAILYHNYVQYLEDMLQDPNLQGMLRSLRVCIYVSTIGCIGGVGGGVARPPRGSIRRTPTPPSSLPFPSGSRRSQLQRARGRALPSALSPL